jgi:hypothetical protein
MRVIQHSRFGAVVPNGKWDKERVRERESRDDVPSIGSTSISASACIESNHSTRSMKVSCFSLREERAVLVLGEEVTKDIFHLRPFHDQREVGWASTLYY